MNVYIEQINLTFISPVEHKEKATPASLRYTKVKWYVLVFPYP